MVIMDRLAVNWRRRSLGRAAEQLEREARVSTLQRSEHCRFLTVRSGMQLAGNIKVSSHGVSRGGRIDRMRRPRPRKFSIAGFVNDDVARTVA